MNVDRLVQSDSLFEVVGQFQRVAFGVRRGEFAIGIAGAGNQAAAQIRRLPVQTHFHQRLLDGLHECVGNVWHDEILPHGQTDFSRAVVVRQIGQTQHLFRGDVANRNRNADPVQPGLLLRINADVGVAAAAVGIAVAADVRRL